MPRSRVKKPIMASKNFVLQKPHGQLTPRVQQVGPEHFRSLALQPGHCILA